MASLLIAALCLLTGPAFGQGLIVDHTKTTITQIPEAAILQAKQNLRIAYGHTSHGSQLIDGMNGLVGFMNGRGYPNNLYAWNEAGSNGALRLDDNAFSSFGANDLGAPNRTAWDGATRSYLAANPTTNVIIWSWCGQVDGSQAEIQNYLDRMNQLEADFPAVRFVYMTGHLNGGGATGNVNVRNNQIRAYCLANNKTLYDFADIESYDPDGLVHYMPLNCDDACNYTSGGQSHNWATEWQAAHVQNVDWYDCGAAHSYPLNANRKAYAAWWLWARLAGWAGPVADSTPPSVPTALHTTSVVYNRVELAWTAASDAESGVSGYRIYRGAAFLSFATGTTFADTTVSAGTPYSYTVRAVNGASLLSGESNAATANTPVPTDTEDPSVPGNLQAGAITTTTLHLTWNAATDNIGVTGYRVYRDGTLRTTVVGTSFDDSSLTPATSYSYRVSARDAAGNESDQSAVLTVETTDPTDTEPPSVPNGLTVGATTTTTVQLSWNAATDNNAVAGYHVYRDGALVATATGTSFGDTGRTASTTYSYRVSAFDAADNESALSDAVAARTLDPSQVVHTLRLQGTAQSGNADAFLFEANPNTNYGASDYFSTIDRFLVQFDLEALPTDCRIVSARVAFYVWAQSNYQADQYLDLYRVTRAWAEDTVTWNNASAGVPWTTAGGDRAERVGRILQLSGRANWDHVFYPPVDLTILVQKWAAGTVPNNGLLMIHSPVTGIGLKAADYGTASAPYLEITYTEEDTPVLYELWMHGRFSDAQLADPAGEATTWGRNADPDGDGTINFFEYALGSNPNAKGDGVAGALQCSAPSGGALDLTFGRRAGTTGVAYSLERSFDLVSWDLVPEAERTEAVGPAGDAMEDVVWQVQAASGQSRAFYRLRLTAQ